MYPVYGAGGAVPPTKDTALAFIWQGFYNSDQTGAAYVPVGETLYVVPPAYRKDPTKAAVAVVFGRDFKMGVAVKKEGVKDQRSVNDLKSFAQKVQNQDEYYHNLSDVPDNFDTIVSLLNTANGSVRSKSQDDSTYDGHDRDNFGRRDSLEVNAPDAGIKNSVLPFVAAVERWEKKTGSEFTGKDALIKKMKLLTYSWDDLVEQANNYGYMDHSKDDDGDRWSY